ncbi:ferric reduction oxidase 7 [Quercus suber]|uniref:Ferric reduction oxidase 7 n=1 Tax=Quercus suber TaxID=58331 RepID=A0AAW0KAR1_QUESU
MAVDDVVHTSHPLLHSNVAHPNNNNNNKKNINFVSLAKWVLKFTMRIVFLAWIALFFFIPTDFGSELYADWIGATNESLFGYTGSYFLIQPRCCIQKSLTYKCAFSGSYLLLYSGPIIIIAFLAVPYLLISAEDQLQLQEYLFI